MSSVLIVFISFGIGVSGPIFIARGLAIFSNRRCAQCYSQYAYQARENALKGYNIIPFAYLIVLMLAHNKATKLHGLYIPVDLFLALYSIA